ncbi:hypothetical protein ABW19_dt0204996 [Dactylella cylindrospora]|nr:hypothetical protein ABW19_dt0204996 [Dactylella cylindrospora]
MILCVDAPMHKHHRLDKLARWIRILLQKSLQGDLVRAESFVQQVLNICKKQSLTNEYPQDELEWIAAIIWNLAVDKNCAGDYPGSKKWAELALSIAGYLKDGGKLEKLLHDKFVKLRIA